jgi:Down syndrome cell adhesion protein
VPPTLNKFTVGEHLKLGQRVSMLCSVTDGDLPMTLKWYREDQPLAVEPNLLSSGGSGSGISITEIGHYESVLRIDNLRPEHNANFTCVAQNYAGLVQHSQTLKVKGRQPEGILAQYFQHQSLQ